MMLLPGLHITQIRLITWPKKLNGRGMDKRIVAVLAWKPRSDGDDMWLAHTEVVHSQWKAEQLEREVA